MGSDLIEYYEGNETLQFIKDVPVDWETTKVIDAEIGEYVIITRKVKYSDYWYLGAKTNEEG